MSSRDKKPSTSRTGGIRTISDLNRPSAHDSDSDSDGPQEYYTGGEKSGMLVQDPSKSNDVDAIFDQARQLGALQGPLENLQPSSSSRSFTGTGRTLSSESVPAAAAPAPQQPESLVHNIVFWRNGFTVNDGPLRSLDDPENAAFLEEPEVRALPFQGVGRTLGSNHATASVPETTVASTPLSDPAPSAGLVVDKSLPSTSIQLRLADGTRMIAHFNHYHTIADVHSFIDASRPGGTRSYQLQTVGFPPKILTDLTQTIEQAGLLNSVVVQRL